MGLPEERLGVFFVDLCNRVGIVLSLVPLFFLFVEDGIDGVDHFFGPVIGKFFLDDVFQSSYAEVFSVPCFDALVEETGNLGDVVGHAGKIVLVVPSIGYFFVGKFGNMPYCFELDPVVEPNPPRFGCRCRCRPPLWLWLLLRVVGRHGRMVCIVCESSSSEADRCYANERRS